MIQLNNLNFGYLKKYPMFKELNLTLEKGHVYGLLGKNGAGKSTLLKNIVGALHPQSGTCEIDGEETHKRKVITMEKIHYLPEQITLPPVKIKSFLMMNSPFYPNFSEDTFNEIVEEFDIPTHLKLTHLSHGQQKKVAIAFAIATNTDWLFLDEPTNGLDIPSKSLFRKVISNHINDNRGIIISTHQIADIDKLIENIVVVDQGSILLNKSLFEISEKVGFKVSAQTTDEIENLLYQEEFGVGRKVIVSNENIGDGEVDIELLFNGLVAKGSNLKELLN